MAEIRGMPQRVRGSGRAEPLGAAAIEEGTRLLPDWTTDGRTLRRRFEFGDFDAAFRLVSRVAAIAAAADHHPDVTFGWGYAEFALTTHSVGGLSPADFGLAARIDGEAAES